VLITEVAAPAAEPTHARYLDDSALASADSAAQAVVLELQHLAR
jgi:phosphate:Na+ symporter